LSYAERAAGDSISQNDGINERAARTIRYSKGRKEKNAAAKGPKTQRRGAEAGFVQHYEGHGSRVAVIGRETWGVSGKFEVGG
jgi:hypothetical protein